MVFMVENYEASNVIMFVVASNGFQKLNFLSRVAVVLIVSGEMMYSGDAQPASSGPDLARQRVLSGPRSR